jgi:metal-responsive CopG/Arc/MetJ family transcriptional regulator
MGKEKIAITIDNTSLTELDRLVKENLYQNRSQAIQEAVTEKIQRLKKTRLAAESAKLSPVFEKQLSEEGFKADMESWPEY